MTVEAYIWRGELLAMKTGHASLRAGGGVYVSYWPRKREGDPAARTVPSGKLGRNACDLLLRRPFTWAESLDEDIAVVGERPDEEVEIRGLNEDAIGRYWRKTQTDPTGYFNLLRMNCSSIVREALRVGYHQAYGRGARRFYPKHMYALYAGAFSDRLVWTPSDVAQYARHLKWLMEG